MGNWLTPAGWFWLGYLTGAAVIVVWLTRVAS